MKQVICHQMRVISEEELAQVYGGGIEAGGLADRIKNGAQRVLSGSAGCVAGAQRAAQGRSPGRYPG
ncbi:bacteriocin [Paludibacterium sp. B53371]|uniref:bacteriocin n=1 Tax=Paludibacterium sp. B53371 TaxID=2806263 RepID=UPI001C051A32